MIHALGLAASATATATATSDKASSHTASVQTAAQTAAQAAARAGPVAQALLKSGLQTRSQLDSTGAQLSSFGQLKSAVFHVQQAAQALGAVAVGSPPAELKATVLQFVSNFNAALKSAQASAEAAGGAGTETGSAGRIGRELSRGLASSPAKLDGLRKLGIQLAADGRLGLDATKLDAALQADPAALQTSLAQAGQSVALSASVLLAPGGQVSGSLGTLNQRAAALTARYSAWLGVAQKFSAVTTATGGTPATSTSTSTATSAAARGLAAYLAMC